MANKISRRTFVKGLAAGAASVAALGVLGSVEMKYPAEGAGNGAGAGTIPVPAGNMSYTPGTYSATAKGIASVSLESGIPVLFGVVTTDNIEQAIERAGTKAGNKGYDCALSAIEMANLTKQL